jgi:hypothetical protein
MNQTIRTYRQLHSFVHQGEERTLQAPTGQRRVSGTDEKRAGKTLWREIKGALVAIVLCACLAVVPVVIRQLAFNPRFVEMLEHTARLLAMGQPF